MITGYGMRRDEFKVVVHPAPVQPEKVEETPLEVMTRMEKAHPIKEKTHKRSSSAGHVVLAFIAPVIALAFLILWITRIIPTSIISDVAMGIILFIVMLIGVFVAWFSAK